MLTMSCASYKQGVQGRLSQTFGTGQRFTRGLVAVRANYYGAAWYGFSGIVIGGPIMMSVVLRRLPAVVPATAAASRVRPAALAAAPEVGVQVQGVASAEVALNSHRCIPRRDIWVFCRLTATAVQRFRWLPVPDRVRRTIPEVRQGKRGAGKEE